MAERKRRGGQAAADGRAGTTGRGSDEAGELVDEQVDDELGGDASDDGDSPVDGSEVASDGGGAGTATKTRSTTDQKSTKTRSTDRRGIFARLANFVREVVSELRKVIWPTRSELLRYTVVVVVFVTIILTIVGLLDYGFAKAVLLVFGNKTK